MYLKSNEQSNESFLETISYLIKSNILNCVMPERANHLFVLNRSSSKSVNYR